LRQSRRGEEKLMAELLRFLRAGEDEKHQRLLPLRRTKTQGKTENPDELADCLERTGKGSMGPGA
jgi:hypothetical protein